MAEKILQIQSKDYLRRKLLPHKGREWRESWTKETTDKLLVLPIAFIGLVPALIIAYKINKEDNGDIYYKDQRVGRDGEITVNKFRSMKPGSNSTQTSLRYYEQFTNDNDDRLTRIGRIIRQIDIDEFPQVFQILSGELSLVEFRAIEQQAINNLKEIMLDEEFNNWLSKKFIGKQGVYDPSVGRVNNPRSDLERIPFQLDYAENASLLKDIGIYFYINLLILNKIVKKIRRGIKKRTVLETD